MRNARRSGVRHAGRIIRAKRTSGSAACVGAIGLRAMGEHGAVMLAIGRMKAVERAASGIPIGAGDGDGARANGRGAAVARGWGYGLGGDATAEVVASVGGGFGRGGSAGPAGGRRWSEGFHQTGQL